MSLRFSLSAPLKEECQKIYKQEKLCNCKAFLVCNSENKPAYISFQKLEVEFIHLGYKVTKLAQAPSKFGGVIYPVLAVK